jgi:hypothetical protein
MNLTLTLTDIQLGYLMESLRIHPDDHRSIRNGEEKEGRQIEYARRILHARTALGMDNGSLHAVIAETNPGRTS